MKTTLVVPCHNEARRLPSAAFLEFSQTHPEVRFLMVDDGSADGTRAALEELARRSPAFSVLSWEKNAGKAEAVRRGMLAALEAGADFVGFWDADLSAPLSELAGLRAALEANPALRAAFGSRVMLVGRTIERRALRHYLSRVFVTAADTVLGLPFYDSQCGAKLFRAEAVRALFGEPFLSRWIFDLEIALRLKALGKPWEETAREVPLEVWRHHGDSRLTMGGGLAALGHLARLWARRR